ncbi:MAG: hypothetical protein ACRDZ4_12570 [Egibacteraceae bacterium]
MERVRSGQHGCDEVAVALESGDAVEALRIADGVEVDELPTTERRARFCVYVARAHALRHDDAATVVLLLQAERHASESGPPQRAGPGAGAGGPAPGASLAHAEAARPCRTAGPAGLTRRVSVTSGSLLP